MRNALLMALALTAAGCSSCEKQPKTESAPAVTAAPAAPAPEVAPPQAPPPQAEDAETAARRAAERAIENESAFVRNHALASPTPPPPPGAPRPAFKVVKRKVFPVPGPNDRIPIGPNAAGQQPQP